ncbi:MAG: replication initiation protein [Sulfurovum sp.]|jgi:plasmid replication initiation protein|nr:MAG: replication initiation protein [Sulfurovum sp.]
MCIILKKEKNKMNKKITNRNIIKQTNNLTTAKYKLTALEMKFIALAIAQIRLEDKDFNTYTIKISELEDKFGVGMNETRLKSFAKGLLSKPFEVKEGKNWIVMNWFSSIKYVHNEARFECRIDDHLKPYLLEIQNHFTKYELASLVKMNSIYAMRIYQMLNTSTVKAKAQLTIDVKELQDLLQVPKSLLGYGQFKQKVIDIALREINEKTELKVKFFEHEKIVKKVISIRFELHNAIAKNTITNFIAIIKKEYANKKIFQDSEKAYFLNDDELLSIDKDNITITKYLSEKATDVYLYLYQNKDSLVKY